MDAPQLPDVPFERHADDVIVTVALRCSARSLEAAQEQRMVQCSLPRIRRRRKSPNVAMISQGSALAFIGLTSRASAYFEELQGKLLSRLKDNELLGEKVKPQPFCRHAEIIRCYQSHY